MYRLIKKNYPNTIIQQHKTELLIEHETFLICETPKRTPIYSATGHKLLESNHTLSFLSAQHYFHVEYSRMPEEQVSVHFSTPFWIQDKEIHYVDYDLNIFMTSRSLVIDDIDLWRNTSSRYPEQEVRQILQALSKTVEQLVQDRFAPLDLLRDVYSRL